MDHSVPYYFLEDHPVRLTLQIFPQTADVKDTVGVPWSCCVSPFLEDPRGNSGSKTTPLVPIEQVARCEECFAYISPFSDISLRYWKCPLCHNRNRLTSALSRYHKSTVAQELPELTQQTVEYELPLDSKGALMHSGQVFLKNGYLSKEPGASRPLVFLAVVDELGGRDYHEAIAVILDVLVGSLPDESRFGLVTMSDRIGLLDLSAPIPHVQFVDIDDLHGSKVRGPLESVDLSDVLCLEELLCPVGGNREHIRASVRGLRELCRGPLESVGKGQRAVGRTVEVLLDLILGSRVAAGADPRANDGAGGGRTDHFRGVGVPLTLPSKQEVDFTFAGCRLMLFLGGVPDQGPGAIDATLGQWHAGGGAGIEAGGGAGEVVARGRKDKARAYYRLQAERAAPHGVSVDVLALATPACNFFGLSSLAPLPKLTGGLLKRHSLLHQRAGESRVESIARSICKEVLQHRAYDGLLRMDFEFVGAGNGTEWDEEDGHSPTLQAWTAYGP
ncbi:unnamed protein product [Choristocarpus tenellus]